MPRTAPRFALLALLLLLTALPAAAHNGGVAIAVLAAAMRPQTESTIASDAAYNTGHVRGRSGSCVSSESSSASPHSWWA